MLNFLIVHIALAVTTVVVIATAVIAAAVVVVVVGDGGGIVIVIVAIIVDINAFATATVAVTSRQLRGSITCIVIRPFSALFGGRQSSYQMAYEAAPDQ